MGNRARPVRLEEQAVHRRSHIIQRQGADTAVENVADTNANRQRAHALLTAMSVVVRATQNTQTRHTFSLSLSLSLSLSVFLELSGSVAPLSHSTSLGVSLSYRGLIASNVG